MSLSSFFSPAFFRKLVDVWNAGAGVVTGRYEVRKTEERESPEPVLLKGYEVKFRDLFEKQLGWKIFGITDTNSMDPVFDIGHWVACEPFVRGKTKVAVGDIVIFGPARISHRVVEMSKSQFKSLGDNNALDDGWHSLNEITHVVRVVSYAR